jgi:UDP-galactopyranose mutase
MKQIVVIGAGFTGSTIARDLADAGKYVTVLEKAQYPGGHASDVYIQGTPMSLYGPHIFHTSKEDVWQYVNRFSEWRSYEHKVMSDTKAGYVPWPINKRTIERVYGHKFGVSPEGAMNMFQEDFIRRKADQEGTFRQKAVKAIGEPLFEYMLEVYNKKMWQMSLDAIPPETFSRVRVKTTDDPLFFDDTYVALPVNGYSSVIQAMLSHQRIRVEYGSTVSSLLLEKLVGKGCTIIMTGPPDEVLEYSQGVLQYQRMDFQVHQGKMAELITDQWKTPVVNFAIEEVSYIRGTRYDKMYGSDYPVCVLETPGQGEKLYPVRTSDNICKHKMYVQELSQMGVICAGRLGSFQYINMDESIFLARKVAQELCK